MTAGRNESVGRIVGAGQGTVREHITVEVIAYGVAVEYGQTIIGVIQEAGIRRIGDVARSVILVNVRRARIVVKVDDTSHDCSV